MGLMNEYIKKRLSGKDLEEELNKLIKEYNKYRGKYLFVYAAAIGKPMPDIGLIMDDYYLIVDILRDCKEKNLDFYIETPGGSGEATEEIVKFLHNQFEVVRFLVSGEAKSAGTIMVLSGDEIMMTQTGSLGPIDAQITIGRTVNSAYDYIQWVKEKREEAITNGKLNPFDANMVAQITPGELSRVHHALKFAEERVIEWLPKYKFKNWDITETRKLPVTEEHKKKRATAIAQDLMNNTKWRSHGRSIKIDDLKGLLTIQRVDDDPKLSDLVYRLQTTIRLLFGSTDTYKIFAAEDIKLFKRAVSREAVNVVRQPLLQKKSPDFIQMELKCGKCGQLHRIYGKFSPDPKIDQDMKRKGLISFPEDNKLACKKCGFEMDLSAHRNDIEINIGKKIITEKTGAK